MDNIRFQNNDKELLEIRKSGRRRSSWIELDRQEIARLKKEFIEIGGDPNRLKFNQGRRTGFVDETGDILVCGDVLPLIEATHPRSVMSSRAALAHELGHMMHRGTKLAVGSWNDEFRASYWAAKNIPNLTNKERVHLIQDAIARTREAGVRIKYNQFMRSILYGASDKQQN